MGLVVLTASCVCSVCVFAVSSVFFFKQKTAYEMRISDWSSDVCSSDLKDRLAPALADEAFANCRASRDVLLADVLKFRRIGHPSEPEANSMVTARQSLLNLDADLRENFLAVATKRKLAEQNVK